MASNFGSLWKLVARWMERMQQVLCRGPAEPEDTVCAEEALPEGGTCAAFSLPSEHTHSGSSMQQPCLPSRVEPRALVSGKKHHFRSTSLGLLEIPRWWKYRWLFPWEVLSYVHLHIYELMRQSLGIIISASTFLMVLMWPEVLDLLYQSLHSFVAQKLACRPF